MLADLSGLGRREGSTQLMELLRRKKDRQLKLCDLACCVRVIDGRDEHSRKATILQTKTNR